MFQLFSVSQALLHFYIFRGKREFGFWEVNLCVSHTHLLPSLHKPVLEYPVPIWTLPMYKLQSVFSKHPSGFSTSKLFLHIKLSVPLSIWLIHLLPSLFFGVGSFCCAFLREKKKKKKTSQTACRLNCLEYLGEQQVWEHMENIFCLKISSECLWENSAGVTICVLTYACCGRLNPAFSASVGIWSAQRVEGSALCASYRSESHSMT